MSELHSQTAAELLNVTPLPAITVNPQGLVTWSNSAAAEVLGGGPGALAGLPLATLLPAIREDLGEGRFRCHVELPAQGGRCWLEASVAEVEDDAAGLLTLYLFHDITDFEARRKGRAAAAAGRVPTRLDEDTGALNRLAVLQELTTQVSRSRRYANPLSLVLIRLDGPEAGSPGLRRNAAEQLREELRWVDVVGAFSDSEFLVVLPESDQEAAALVMGKLRGAVARVADGQSVAVGAATWQQGDDMQTLLDRVRSGAAPARAA